MEKYIQNFATTAMGQLGLEIEAYRPAESKVALVDLLLADWRLIFRHISRLNGATLGRIADFQTETSFAEVMYALINKRSDQFPYRYINEFAWPTPATGNSNILRWLAAGVLVAAMADIIWAKFQKDEREREQQLKRARQEHADNEWAGGR